MLSVIILTDLFLKCYQGSEQIVYEMIGYTLHSHLNFEKSFIFIGEGENGKSILLDVISDIIGEDNYTSTSPQELSERFGTSSVFNKLACINHDIPTSALNRSDIFKRVASGNRIRSEFKNKNAFEFKPYATMIFAGNKMPKSYDKTHGFYRRLIIANFTQQFLEGDPRRRDPVELKNELLSESSGIIIKSILAYKEVVNRGKFYEDEHLIAAKDAYKSDNETFLAFC